MSKLVTASKQWLSNTGPPRGRRRGGGLLECGEGPTPRLGEIVLGVSKPLASNCN